MPDWGYEGIAINVKLIGVEEIERGIKKIKDGFENVQKGGRKLVAGLLGVMFAGMALNRAFGFLWKEVRRFGIETAFTVMKMSLMIAVISSPRFQAFRGIIWDLTKAFLNLPVGVRQTIGEGIILLGWVGTAMSIFGSFGLGLLGIGTTFKALGITISGFSLGSLAPLGIAVGALAIAWITNFNNIRDTAKDIWEAIKNIFGGAFKFISGIITEDPEKIKEGFKLMLAGLLQIAEESMRLIAKTMVDAITMPFTLMGNLFSKAGGILGIKVLKDLGELLKEPNRWLDEQIDKVDEYLDKQINKLAEVAPKITPTVKTTTSLEQWKNELSGMDKVSGGQSIWNLFKQGMITNDIYKQLSDWWIGMKGFQMGGKVLSTGAYMLHKGEEVIPKYKANTMNYSPNIIINANVSSSFDIDDLANQINEKLNMNYMSRMM